MIFTILIVCDIITALSMSAAKYINRFKQIGFSLDNSVDSILDPFGKKNFIVVAINTALLIISAIVVNLSNVFKFSSTLFTVIVLVSMLFYTMITRLVTRTFAKKWVNNILDFMFVVYLILIGFVLVNNIPFLAGIFAKFAYSVFIVFFLLDVFAVVFLGLFNLSIVNLNMSINKHINEYKDGEFNPKKVSIFRKAFLDENKVSSFLDKDKVKKDYEEKLAEKEEIDKIKEEKKKNKAAKKKHKLFKFGRKEKK